ncbi:hypothetical protein, conserved [Trypanosoma brucei brucei TREU927]|uniref:Uncharacterized protein n=1 Tax=Trypanosoma brucei brucei (strain 927/4 GUTat10.1) TaxID=185431 RepID=Q57WP3_TRYB2|nr:hypothetical protein, conserved [Trypanosoma brucei brucei TREU927]AAX69949.1 hypothetical protein, conserved [Trypanosoma brucei]AAZ12222.1 hypothetical protein, conserved [Trypanosoma brucei brucei TREU927]
MFRVSFPLFCTMPSVETAFRRALGAQSIVLDLVPVKKPLIDGSLSWFVDKNVEIVLVSGVCGTSPDLVAERVKSQAVQLLQICGEGDAQKGCHAIKHWVEKAAGTRSLLCSMDLQVRLLFSRQVVTDGGKLSATSSSGNQALDKVGNRIHCSIYETDAWEPYSRERHLGDVTADALLEEVLHKALQIVQRDAEVKEQHLVSESERELNLVLSCGKEPGVWSPDVNAYHLEFSHMKCKDRELCTDLGAIAVSWGVHDRSENVEMFNVPLVRLKDSSGLVYGDCLDDPQQSLIDEETVSLLEAKGAIDTITGLVDATCVRKVANSVWSIPLLHAQLLQAGLEFLCGYWSPTRVEDYMRSCGRLDIDVWLSERGRPATIPMLPRCASLLGHMCYLQESLPLEYVRSPMMLLTSAGRMDFKFYMATTTGGHVVTATSCFSSAEAACSLLFPCHSAMVQSAGVGDSHRYTDIDHQRNEHVCTLTEVNSSTNRNKKSGGSGDNDQRPSVTVRVIDVEASLRKLGVVRGSFANATVQYFDDTGQVVLQFNEMDSIRGIARMIKRVRWSKGATFTSVDLQNGPRAPVVIASRALGSTSLPKPPPYSKKFRLPIPLVPGGYSQLRFTSALEMNVIECKILEMFKNSAEDPLKWHLHYFAPCYFNKWRMTRGIVSTLMHYDPQFHYMVERCRSSSLSGGSGTGGGSNGRDDTSGNDNGGALVLRLYSGERLMEEVKLQESTLLFQVRENLIRYASRWSMEVPSLEEAAFPLKEFKKGGACTFRNFVSWFLQNSEVFTTHGENVSLELEITTNVRIQLASCRDWSGPSPTRDELCRLFLESQFPLLVPIVEIQKRLYYFFDNCTIPGELTIRCVGSDACVEGDRVIRCNYRWELLQVDSGTGVECLLASLEATEGDSRRAALEKLLTKVWTSCCAAPRPTTQAKRGSKLEGSGHPSHHCPKSTIAWYQHLLAQQRGLHKVVHEYDAKNNVLTVKGISADTNKGVNVSGTVIRVVPLRSEYPLIFLLHRYYRMELGLPDPPQPRGEDELRVVSLLTLYQDCNQHFPASFPPISEAITTISGKNHWRVILRLPSNLFALETPSHLEYVYLGKGKHEGKRAVVCDFYRSLHGKAPASLQEYLSKVTSLSPPTVGEEKCSSCVLDGIKPVVVAKPRRGGHNSMYDELRRLIGEALLQHVGYEGLVECRLSYITGISASYVGQSSSNDDCVDLFRVVINTEEWLPFQLLRALASCARRLLSIVDLEASLFRLRSRWPSLFLEASSNERLFCTTFLRRYWGLRVYEGDDVDEFTKVPGSIYLVERVRPVSSGRDSGHYEASLLLLQAPFPPSTTAFTKVLALHRNVSAARARFGLWAQVSRKLVRPQESDAPLEAFDRAVISTSGATSSGTEVRGE